jgi:BirA family biotin operon repressor/biotin-[acetyl-CoA-carboxylase] ligase
MERVVRVLADHATVVVSGTKLAQELGTTRGEVWRLVQHLRALGVAIAGHPSSGYQLATVPDLLLPAVLAPLIRGTLFERGLRHFFRVDSTNLAAMAAAQAGAPEGTVFVAEEQTAGRGRGGHTWHSAPSAGVYLSAILRPQMPPADALLLSLATGLAVTDAVFEVTHCRPDLRWPNDLLLGDKKFCGVLIEMQAEPTRVRHVVVGIGLNVNHDSFPADIAPIATSLRVETGRGWSRVAITAAVLRSLDREYRNLRDRASIIRRFEQASSFARNKQVFVEEEGGYEGTTAGLDEHGFLRVQTASGMKTVLSGGVRARKS